MGTGRRQLEGTPQLLSTSFSLEYMPLSCSGQWASLSREGAQRGRQEQGRGSLAHPHSNRARPEQQGRGWSGPARLSADLGLTAFRHVSNFSRGPRIRKKEGEPRLVLEAERDVGKDPELGQSP